MADDLTTPEARARHRAEEWAGLWWHVAVYVVVNAFLWIVDWVSGDGIGWAYWTTIPWGIGLAFHVASYLIDTRGVQQRKYERYLAEERAREHQHT